jgi:GMP synthase-like glutamine amidotransferase
MVAEQIWLEQALRAPTPLLGTCLGAQLLAIAAGGRVQRMTAPEVGWTPAEIDGVGILDVLQWHEDMIVPPSMARIEAATAHCVQMFSLDETRIGVQFHPEWDDASLLTLHAGFKGCLLPGPGEVERQSPVDLWFEQLMERWARSWLNRAGRPGLPKRPFKPACLLGSAAISRHPRSDSHPDPDD